jgi:hypothetical protein
VSGPHLVAVGWATVDVDRAAAAWPARDRRRLPDDPDLGARAFAIEGISEVVLLEPITEGRLAASLARFGEGPVVVYVRPPSRAATRSSGRDAGGEVRIDGGARAGPFGPQALVGRGRPFGPFVIAVLDETATDTIER